MERGTSTVGYLSPKAESRRSDENHGRGAFASEPIEAGETVAVWGGRVITPDELPDLTDRERMHTLQVEEGLYLAPVGPPEPADFVNHSCEPNAGLRGQITLVAMRRIEPGEEICFDYAMVDGSPYDEFDCRCGAERCRGRVTGEDWRRPELWERYEGYFSPYLARRIAELRSDR